MGESVTEDMEGAVHRDGDNLEGGEVLRAGRGPNLDPRGTVKR